MALQAKEIGQLLSFFPLYNLIEIILDPFLYCHLAVKTSVYAVLKTVCASFQDCINVDSCSSFGKLLLAESVPLKQLKY